MMVEPWKLQVMIKVKAALRFSRADGEETLIQGEVLLKKLTGMLVVKPFSSEETFTFPFDGGWVWRRRNMKSSNCRARVIVIQGTDGSWLRLTFAVTDESDFGVVAINFFERFAPEKLQRE